MRGELLRRCPSLLALSAESNPYVVVAQLGAEDPAGIVAGELARVIGRPAAEPLDGAAQRAYGLEWAWRLAAQWPRVTTGPPAGGVAGDPGGQLVPVVVAGLAPVMATAPPRPGRWRTREAELAGVLADERTLAVAARLGYEADART